MTKVEVLDEVRRVLVIAGINGERMCISIGRQAPDFKSAFTDEKMFPTDKIFDFHKWRDIKNYKSILKETEDTDT